jgi:hypothetical protein
MAIAKCSCGFSKKVDKQYVGKKAKCPKCKKNIIIVETAKKKQRIKDTVKNTKISKNEKGFLLASVLSLHIYLKEVCNTRNEFIASIKHNDEIEEIKNQLLLDKTFVDVPDQNDLFEKAICLLLNIYVKQGTGIETNLFSLINTLSNGLEDDIKKSSFVSAKNVALKDGIISANEQNFLNQIENLLNISVPTKATKSKTHHSENLQTDNESNSNFERKFNTIWSVITFLPNFVSKKIIGVMSTTFSSLPMEIKLVILAAIGCVIFALVGGMTFLAFNKVKTTTTVKATFKGYEKIDKLYTAFTVVPLLKRSSSKFRPGTFEGYVTADYDMAIGYNNISEYIGKLKFPDFYIYHSCRNALLLG